MTTMTLSCDRGCADGMWAAYCPRKYLIVCCLCGRVWYWGTQSHRALAAAAAATRTRSRGTMHLATILCVYRIAEISVPYLCKDSL